MSAEPQRPKGLTVRFVQDTESGECWFEEKLGNGQFVKIPETKAICEGNSRSNLMEVIEKRRQQRLAIFRSYGPEQVIPIC